MAILKQGENEVEVRIRRDSDGTYFDEYVKLGDRDKPDGRECERYIAGEPGTTYSVEITLKNGYDFGKCKGVQAQLYFPESTRRAGVAKIHAPSIRTTLNSDHTMAIDTVHVNVGKRTFKGGKFVFQELTIVNRYSGIGTGQRMTDPEDSGAFHVCIQRINSYSKQSEAEKAHTQASESSQIAFLDGKMKPEATEVDADRCQKQGIAYAVSFAGGKWTPGSVRRTTHLKGSETLTFQFLSRSGESFEPLGIIRYPPQLYCYSWDHLNKMERKTALTELQFVAKARAREESELLTGELLPRRSRGLNDGDPPEWRPWGLMAAWEKKKAFETLQKENKTYERAQTQKQIAGVPDEQLVALKDDTTEDLKHLVSPVNDTSIATITNENDEPSGENTNSSTGKLASESSATKSPTSQTNTNDSLASVEVPFGAAETNGGAVSLEAIPVIPLPAAGPPNVKVEVKEESVEEVSRPPKRRRVEITIDDDNNDEEIEKLREEEQNLTKEIEEAERLVGMKRKREALQAKIKATEARKSKF